jgi:hypothetical protein
VQPAPIVSLVRTAVRIVYSSAWALRLSRLRSAAMKRGISAHGSAL